MRLGHTEIKPFLLGQKNKMKVYQKLKFNHEGLSKEILFGEPDSKEEFEKMYSLRFDVYSGKKYFSESFGGTKNATDKDHYDVDKKCFYAIAMVDDGRIIGSVRLIRDKILPTELFFKFKTPKNIVGIPLGERGEVGRLVIQPYSKSSFLPRNLVLLFLLKTLFQIGHDVGVKGGYSFVKRSLFGKLGKLKVPIHLVHEYVQDYPKNGILYNYFNQLDNPVYPAYFLTDEIEHYLDAFFDPKSRIIKYVQKDDTFILNDTLYTKFLRRMHIL